MNCRELLALIDGAAALAPFGATAQPGLPVIGYLSSRSTEAETNRTPFLVRAKLRLWWALWKAHLPRVGRT